MSLYEGVTVRLHGDLSRKVSAAMEGSIQRTFSDLTLFDVRSHFARLRADIGRTGPSANSCSGTWTRYSKPPECRAAQLLTRLCRGKSRGTDLAQ